MGNENGKEKQFSDIFNEPVTDKSSKPVMEGKYAILYDVICKIQQDIANMKNNITDLQEENEKLKDEIKQLKNKKTT